MDNLLFWSSVVLLALVTPASLYLGVLSLAGARRPRPFSGSGLKGRLVVVVPAHDEAQGIGRTLKSLLAAAAVDGDAEVLVVADNCSDDTAAIARHSGARVLERHAPDHRGKGYALDFAFQHLLVEDFEAMVVVDADTLVPADFVAQLRAHFVDGVQALQVRYMVLNSDDSARTRLAEIALAAFNVLRPRGRERLGLSAGILGNGFALRRAVLRQVPYQATSVVEDLEYHLRLLESGVRVRFVDQTCVRGEMPAGNKASATQRARWEGGRLRMLLTHAPILARRVLVGQWRLAEPLAELLLLPLSYHVLLIGLGGALALVAVQPPLLSWLAMTNLTIVGLHVLIALRVVGLPWSRLNIVWHLPGYLLWKLRMLVSIVGAARRNSPWVRTDRGNT